MGGIGIHPRCRNACYSALGLYKGSVVEVGHQEEDLGRTKLRF